MKFLYSPINKRTREFATAFILPGLSVLLLFISNNLFANDQKQQPINPPARERISINDGWRFMLYTSEPDKLMYDERPEVQNTMIILLQIHIIFIKLKKCFWWPGPGDCSFKK